MSPSRRTGKEPVLWRCAQGGNGARAWSAGCQAAHRGGAPPRATARRRDGDIAPYRHAARRVRTRGTRAWSAAKGRGERGARESSAAKGRGEGGMGGGVGAIQKKKPMRVTMRTRVRHSLVLRFSGLRKAALPKVGIFDRMGKSIYSNL